MISKMATKIRFLDEFRCLYNVLIFELLMHRCFDQVGLKLTYKFVEVGISF